MLTVSKRSWHYRWLKVCVDFSSNHDLSWRPPHSLCEYFWSFVFYTGKTILYGSLLAFIIIAFPIAGWSWLHNGSHNARMIFCVYCLGIAAVLSLIAFMALRDKIRSMEAQGDDQPLTIFRVFKERIKAHKEKVCPTIRYKD